VEAYELLPPNKIKNKSQVASEGLEFLRVPAELDPRLDSRIKKAKIKRSGFGFIFN